MGSGKPGPIYSMKVKLFVSGGGNQVSYLHSDKVQLSQMGKKEVVRASDVEFDHDKQEWVATLMDGTEIARDKFRDRVLEVERLVIENMLAAGRPVPNC